jgi:hypothetical protein
MKYLKVWTDFESVLSPLTADEIGRLFLAMLHYAATGEEPSQFIGNEVFLWAVAKRDIDMMSEKSETMRENGLKGGRPKSKENQIKANESKKNQTKPNESLKEKKIKENKIKEIKRNDFVIIDDDDAAKINAEQNRVLDAAEDAGFQRTNSVRARLIDLFSVHGEDKMLAAIESCVKHGATNLAYLEAVLKGEPKKLPAQNYDQRNYSGEDDEAFSRMVERIEKKAQGG